MEDFNFYTISLSLLALIYAWFFIRRLCSSNSPSPPSPSSLPIIGNIHQLGKLPHRSLWKLSQKHGPLMLLRFGPKPVLVVSSADVARQIIKTHDLAFADKPVMEYLNRIFYDGNDVISLPYGDRWRKLRNIILHELLNSSRVRSFGSIREEETSLLMARIEELSAASEPVNLTRMLAAASNALITRAAFGKKYSETEHGKMFLEFVEEASGMFEFSLRDSFPWLGWIDRLNGRDAAVDRLVEKRDASLDSIIQDHLQSSDASRDNIMGILLGNYKGDIPGVSIDLMSIKGVILDIFTGGTETTTTAVIWLMTELIRHPTVMKKLQDEIRGTMKGKHHVTDDDLQEMPYMKAVIKELIRLHPPLPIFSRVARDHVNLMGYEVAPSTLVLINAWAIGQDPAYWEEPEKFMPERFLDSSIDFKGHDFHLIPFGSGRRICPGYGFATAAIGHMVANLMLRFDWALPNGAQGEDLDVTERPGFAIGKDSALIVVATINPNI
ncbi:cytochrome P450 736A117-like [Salvia splendens]|uniref:cytochrome P450 736A117-like n=1 Tax=Salvia splendens TaxID=180675 RepID=UPI001C25CAD9|nr:cytochrome P450 736A117-like [Salvia splendens]